MTHNETYQYCMSLYWCDAKVGYWQTCSRLSHSETTDHNWEPPYRVEKVQNFYKKWVWTRTNWPLYGIWIDRDTKREAQILEFLTEME